MDSKAVINKKLLSQIRSGKQGRDDVIRQLYHDQSLKTTIFGLVINNGGKEENALEVFNTTLIQFVKTVIKNNDMEIETSIRQYLIGIAKYVWLKELSDRKKHRSEEWQIHHDKKDVIQPEALVILKEKKELLTDLLAKLGRNCKEVLMHWANGYRMHQIAAMLGYQSEGMAKKKKYKCMKQLLIFIEENPTIKEALR